MRLIPLSVSSASPRGFRKPVIFGAIIVAVLAMGTISAVNTRRMQHRMECVERMTRVGQALIAYKSTLALGGQTLERLVELGAISRTDTVCPGSKSGKPNYVLVTPSSSPRDPTMRILVHEPLSNHLSGVNVFFEDGRYKFVPKKYLSEIGLDIESK